MTINEIKKLPEFQEIIDRAEYIKSFGTPFQYRINRVQPKNMIVKLTKTILDEESEVEPFVKYFFKLTDVYNYLNKNSEKVNQRLESIVLRVPTSYKDDTFEYKLEYEINDNPGIILTKLDLSDLDINPVFSYWLSNDGNLYKKIEAQYRFDIRKWQYNQAGNKTVIIKGKTLSYETLLSRMTEEKEII